jgi:hypothetical protein
MPPFALLLDVLLYAVLPSLVVAAAVTALAARFGGAGEGAAALGLASGVLLGCWLRGALPLVPGDSPWNRLPWAALGALCAGRLACLPSLRATDAFILRAAATAASAWWIIPPESQAQLGWLTPAFAGVVLLLWLVLGRWCARAPGAVSPFGLALTFLAASVVLIHAGSARLTDIATVVSAALTGVAIAAWPRSTPTGGVAPVCAVLLPGLLLIGQQETFAEVPWYAFAFAMAAPLLPGLTLFQAEQVSVRRRVLQVALVALPLVAAIAAARSAGPLEW